MASPYSPGRLVAEAVPGDNAAPLSVGELAARLKRVVEGEFGHVRLRGEISGWKRAASGHAYLALKDEAAVIDAVIWRGQAGAIPFSPRDGVEVVATGRLTTYPGRSKYQLVVERLELAGAGALMALLEKLKAELAAEGLFDPARRRPLPFLPRVIGVVTSPTGAVIRDILHRLADRCPTHVVVWPVRVQGEGAAAEVAAAVRGFSALPAAPAAAPAGAASAPALDSSDVMGRGAGPGPANGIAFDAMDSRPSAVPQVAPFPLTSNAASAPATGPGPAPRPMTSDAAGAAAAPPPARGALCAEGGGPPPPPPAGATAAGPGRVPRPDLVIVARGGGSIEDLWAFNEEAVVRAVAASTIPVISAVGHETDTTLCDHAADRRAPTPTAAAELAVPVLAELRLALDAHAARAERCARRHVGRGRERLDALARLLPRREALLAPQRQRLDEAAGRLALALERRAAAARGQLDRAGAALRPALLDRRLEAARVRADAAWRLARSLSPERTLERGYARVEARADGATLATAAAARAAGPLRLVFADGALAVRPDEAADAPRLERPARRAYAPAAPGPDQPSLL